MCLTPAASVDLLARIIGAERSRRSPRSAAAVAQLCGHLPLALRIAGARLSARPHWGIQQLAERLADETRRLDELTHADMGIRASISLSYEGVGEQARRLFRRLALWEAPTFPGWLGAALLGQRLAGAGDLLDELIAAQLVEVTGAEAGPHARYRIHDLIRVFARERLAAEEPPAVRKAALERALGALLCVTEEAYRRYYGSNCRHDTYRCAPVAAAVAAAGAADRRSSVVVRARTCWARVGGPAGSSSGAGRIVLEPGLRRGPAH